MASSNSNFIEKGQVDAERVSAFGRGPDGELVERVTIANGGTTASIITWGATVQDLRREGVEHSLVLGSSDFEAYLDQMQYFGAIVGPVANRVAKGRFEIDGVRFDLERNEGDKTTLHGGAAGTGQRNWSLLACDSTSCTLGVTHPNGAGGFPGDVTVQVHYALDATGTLTLEILAKSDRKTHLNFAHHGYWNLDGTNDLSNHTLQIAASTYLPVDGDLIPVGTPQPVAGTAFDYRNATPIVSPPGMALDHNFCLDQSERELRQICRVEAGKVQLEVLSTEPGLQVFDATGMNTAPFVGHGGRPYGQMAGLALEPQKWPDAPNQPEFPSTLMQPGEIYRQVSHFRINTLSN